MPATALPNGQVLVSGGFSFAGIQASAELFDPATARWQLGVSDEGRALRAHGDAPDERARLLATGGANLDDGYVAPAELSIRRAGTWQRCGSSAARAREPHRVAAGRRAGARRRWAGAPPHGESRSAEIYDPQSNSVGGPRRRMRGRPPTTTRPWTLADGRVIVTGGDRGERTTSVRAAEIYDPGVQPLDAGREHARWPWVRTTPRPCWATGGCSSPAAATARRTSEAPWSHHPTNRWARRRQPQDGAGVRKSRSSCRPGGMSSSRAASPTPARCAAPQSFSPATGRWRRTGSLRAARGHASIALTHAGVLVAGGGPGTRGASCPAPSATPGVEPGAGRAALDLTRRAGRALICRAVDDH